MDRGFMAAVAAAAAPRSQQYQAQEGQSQRGAAQFIPRSLVHMEKICAEYEKAMLATAENVGKAEVRARLYDGIWYPVHHFKALKRHGLDERISLLARQRAFLDGRVALGVFERCPSKLGPLSFRLVEGFTPSEGLNALDGGLSILDCGTVCVLADFRALQDVLGTEKFNRLFSKKLLFDLNSLMELRKRKEIKDESELQEGDSCYFQSIKTSTDASGKEIPGYVDTHPFDHGRGWNVICRGGNEKEKTYLGFGLPASKPVKGKDIEDALFDAYLEEPFLAEEAIPPAVLQQTPRKKPVQITREQFDAAPPLEEQIHPKSRLHPVVIQYDLEKIQQLIDADIEEVEAVFARFK